MINRKQKKQLKVKYKRHFDELRVILNEHDPEGLIEAECPEDEYDFETAEILAGMMKCENVEECKILVARVFNEAFGRRIDKDDYEELSKPIWEWWSNNEPPKEEKLK